MRIFSMARCVASLAAFILIPTSVQAAVIVAGTAFNDNAFVDTLVTSTGIFNTSGGTLADELTGSDLNTYGFCFGGPSVCTLTLAFTDNVLVNGAGADLAVYEQGVPDPFEIFINGITMTFNTASTGIGNYNVGFVDLDLFGIAPGGTVTSFVARSIDNGTTISFAVFGALNSEDAVSGVPEPSTLGLAFAGVLAAVVSRKFRS